MENMVRKTKKDDGMKDNEWSKDQKERERLRSIVIK